MSGSHPTGYRGTDTAADAADRTDPGSWDPRLISAISGCDGGKQETNKGCFLSVSFLLRRDTFSDPHYQTGRHVSRAPM